MLFSKKKKNPVRRNKNQSPLRMESLEDRRLMANLPGSPASIEIVGSVVTVNGTSDHDRISVTIGEARTQVNVFDGPIIKTDSPASGGDLLGPQTTTSGGPTVSTGLTPPSLPPGKAYLIEVRSKTDNRVLNQREITRPVSLIRVDGREGNDDIAFRGPIPVDTAIFGGEGNDYIIGSAGVNNIYGEAGSDIISAGDEDDFIHGGPGLDDIDANGGNDHVTGGDDRDAINGGDGNDSIFGGAGSDKIDGGKGDDTLRGESGNDTIRGGDDNDTIDGGAGNDTLLGEKGNDTLTAGTGDDTLRGGDDNDTLFGRLVFNSKGEYEAVVDAGINKLYGDDGDDTLVGDPNITSHYPYGVFANRFLDPLREEYDEFWGGAGVDTFQLIEMMSDRDRAEANIHDRQEGVDRVIWLSFKYASSIRGSHGIAR